MKQTMKRTKAIHTTRPRAAKLETPKGKRAVSPTTRRHKKARFVCAGLQTAYRNVAEKLAIVLQHPATPDEHLKWLRTLAKIVAPLADVEINTIIASHPKSKDIDAKDAFLQLGLAMASALENDDMPVDVWNELLGWSWDIARLLRPENTVKAEIWKFRATLQAYAAA